LSRRFSRSSLSSRVSNGSMRQFLASPAFDALKTPC
jgi:hypothetical protein